MATSASVNRIAKGRVVAKIVIDVAFELRQKVYFISDPDQLERVITAIKINPGDLVYYVSHKGEEIAAYDFELSTTKDYTK